MAFMTFEEREREFQKDFPDGFTSLCDELDKLKIYGLYCGECGHGLGCEHLNENTSRDRDLGN